MKIKNYYKKLNTIALSAIVSMSSSLCSGALSEEQKDAVRRIMADMMENYTALSQGNASTAESYKQSFAELKLLEEDWDEEVEVNGAYTTINKELKKYEQKEKLCEIIEGIMDAYTSNFVTPSDVEKIKTFREKFEKLNLKNEDWDESIVVQGIQTTINSELKKYEIFFNTCKDYLEEGEVYKNGIESQEASEKLQKPVVIIAKNNTEFPMDEAIAFCIEMRKQALDLSNDTPVQVNYTIFYKNYLIVNGMPNMSGFYAPISINDEQTRIDNEFAKFNVVQTLKKTLGNRRAKIIVWSPDNYREAIIALYIYEADFNARVEVYGQVEWFVGAVTNVLKLLDGDYAKIPDLKKTTPCTLAWMKDSVYGKTYLIYQFFSLQGALKSQLLSAAKAILASIAKSSDFNFWLRDNEDVNVVFLKTITLDETIDAAPTSIWNLNADIPCDTFFKLVIQIASHLCLAQKSVNTKGFYDMISDHSIYSEEKVILNALFTCCVSPEDPNYNKLKNKLIEKGVPLKDNQ